MVNANSDLKLLWSQPPPKKEPLLVFEAAGGLMWG